MASRSNTNIFAFPGTFRERDVGRFDYRVLPYEIAREAKAAATTIRTLLGEIDERVVLIGEELIQIKKRLPHGEWLPWIKAEFSWTARHAQYLMAAGRGVGRNTQSKIDTRHFWLTPPEKLAEIYRVFNIDFDCCPYPRPEGFDALAIPSWGQRNYVNPPFDNIHPFVKKAIEEYWKGKMSVIVLPICAMGDIARLLVAGATQWGGLEIPDWRAIEDGTINPAPPQSRQPCVWLVLRPGSQSTNSTYSADDRLTELEAVVANLTNENAQLREALRAAGLPA